MKQFASTARRNVQSVLVLIYVRMCSILKSLSVPSKPFFSTDPYADKTIFLYK